MPWKTRNQSCYYYRSVRRNGRVTTQYLGHSPAAAQVDAQRQQDRATARNQLQDVKQQHAVQEELFQQLETVTNHILRLTLTQAGYHQHDRGQWRKKRSPP